MTAAVKEAGGVMTEEDLASYHGKIEEPASVPYRGYTVYKAGILESGSRASAGAAHSRRLRPPAMGQGSADALHTTVEAIKLAYADRDRYYGDPDFVRVPGDGAALGAIRRAAPCADRPAPREPRSSGPATRSTHERSP